MKKQNYLDFVHGILSSEEDFLLFKEFYQKRLPKSIKLIQSRICGKEIEAFLSDRWWKFYLPDFLASSWNSFDDVKCVENIDVKSLWSHSFHNAWLFYIQEISAGLSAQVLGVEKWDVVLDLCAAPGWKTVQLADRLLNLWGWHVFANELSFARRKALVFNLNRCWLYNTSILWYDWVSVGDLAHEMFDKVLVDAPCSWEGMQYKYDKNVVYWDQVGAEKLAKLQKELLLSWLKALKVWGELVYSTCTLNPYENEWVISYVLEQLWDRVELINVDIKWKSFWLEKYLDKWKAQLVARFWPHIQKTWGFFIAKFRKLKSLSNTAKVDERFLKKSEYDYSDSLRNRVMDYLMEERGVICDEKYQFFASKDFVYVKDNTEINNKWLFIEKQWIPIIKLWFRWDFIPQQWIVTVFWNIMSKNIVELDYESLQKISDWSDIPWNYWIEGKFVCVRWNSIWLFVAKQVKNLLKMKL